MSGEQIGDRIIAGVETTCAAQTRRLGQALGEILQPGQVVLLEGDLGAGKTTLTQGIAAGLGVKEQVTSPTFTLINEYQGRYPVFHLDAYRLEGNEAEALGLEEYLEQEQGVALVEWPGRVEAYLPSSFLVVSLYYRGLHERFLEARARGDHAPLLEEWRQRCGF